MVPYGGVQPGQPRSRYRTVVYILYAIFTYCTAYVNWESVKASGAWAGGVMIPGGEGTSILLCTVIGKLCKYQLDETDRGDSPITVVMVQNTSN